MGLIRAGLNAAGGVLADQWKEFFSCEAIPERVLALKGRKSSGRRSVNTKGSDNVITTGSVILVADGQCMMIVDQGKIVEFAAEPGEYTYDASTAPTIFCGDLGEGVAKSFNEFGRRFTFGGEQPKDQRIYYFNTKELTGNKYGTPSPVPFRVVDNNIGLDMDVGIRCFGVFSYRICDPMLFYKNVCGNVTDAYTRDRLDDQLRSELLGALGMAFGRISEMGIRYSALQMHTMELADTLNDVLSKKWREKRGLEIVNIGISSLTPVEEDAKRIQQLQSASAFRDPRNAAAQLFSAQADATRTAAGNAGGAALGFMGMNMAQQAGGNAAQLYQMGQQQEAAAPAANSWKCACGATVTGKFCPECGAKKPGPTAAGGWKCPKCGAQATGKFCPECGTKKPEDDGWKCACGAVNKGKFCSECGAKKPAGVPQYRCDKCGWEPPKGIKPPKFCPECGDPFDDGDIV
ncbi:MAG: SPFH domain-containing protein [Clostridiales bacterium]|nr:SPFH domain-containing protein [Clostridiales bacterium]